MTEDDRPLSVIFATIHHRSSTRPDGYSDAEISWLNVIGNRHIPELYETLLADHVQRFPNHEPEGRD
jgi:hypothetical protein